jgi:hypothetical protein
LSWIPRRGVAALETAGVDVGSSGEKVAAAASWREMSSWVGERGRTRAIERGRGRES